jgi:serralysin
MSVLKYDGSAAALTAATTRDLSGGAGADTLTGGATNDGFWGGDDDRMVGGLGDDTYFLQGLRTQVVELTGEGVDKIVAWQNVYLGDHPAVENLVVGNDKTYGAGNALDNVIEGQGGSQQLYGGLGQDVLIGGAGADVFIIVKGEGNDVVQDFAVAEDKLRLKAGLTSFEQVKAAMTQVGADVKLDLGGGDGVIFRNITIGQFTAANFQLELDPATLGPQTFADEFSGPLSIWDAESNPTGRWRPDFGYQGSQGTGSYTLISNNEKQIYTSPYFRDHSGDFAESPFVSNADGTLSIWARASSNPEIFGYGYTSGFISTKPTFSQTYGFFEMRADIPSAAGAWPAFWLIPADGSWPPELDVMEALTYDPRATWTTQHSQATGSHTSSGQLNFTPDTASGFHTYAALWTPSEIVWYVDNVEVFRSATPADMNKPMFMIANLALGGWGGPINAAQLPAEFKIDYIRAYALPGQGGAPAAAPAAPDTSADGGRILTSTGSGAVLTGGAGADTLVGSHQGSETLTGGGGSDVFKFGTVPWSPSRIKDFVVGVDKLDLSSVLAGYTGSDPIADGWLFLFDDGAGGTKVCVDTDGRGAANPWPLYVTNLDGVPANGLTAAALLLARAAPPPPPAQPTAAAPLPPPEPAPAALGISQPAPSAGGVGSIGDDHMSGRRLFGAAGNDTLSAADGEGFLRGEEGDDKLIGGEAFDDLHGNMGDDSVWGGLGDDWVVGGKDHDHLYGEDGHDVVLGNMGDDTLDAGAGNDVVRGGQGGDSVQGAAGDDFIAGDRGDDTLAGGAGADIFHTWSQADGDRVIDFNAGEGDRVNVAPGSKYSLAQVGEDVVIDVEGARMVLVGVQLASLPPGWIFEG